MPGAEPSGLDVLAGRPPASGLPPGRTLLLGTHWCAKGFLSRQYLRMMGMPPATSFLAWFLENAAVMALGSAALAVVLKTSGIFAHSNAFIVFLFLLDFGVSVVMLSYLLSACFRRAATAALCCSLLYLASFLPYIVLLVLRSRLSAAAQMLLVSECAALQSAQRDRSPPTTPLTHRRVSLPFPPARAFGPPLPRPPRRNLLWLRGPAGRGGMCWGQAAGWAFLPHSPSRGDGAIPSTHGSRRL